MGLNIYHGLATLFFYPRQQGSTTAAITKSHISSIILPKEVLMPMRLYCSR